MTAAIAWVVLPLVLGLLSLGCGLLLEVVAGTRLPRPLLLPAGFVVVSLATQFPHMSDATARLQTPFVAAGRTALAGYVKLDDTATYMAMLDRAATHAYDATGLAPSTYETFLQTAYVFGYPLGSLLPLGDVGFEPPGTITSQTTTPAAAATASAA